MFRQAACSVNGRGRWDSVGARMAASRHCRRETPHALRAGRLLGPAASAFQRTLRGLDTTRKPELETAICRKLLGANALEKSSETPAGMASIFPMCLRSNILRHLAIPNSGFRVQSRSRDIPFDLTSAPSMGAMMNRPAFPYTFARFFLDLAKELALILPRNRRGESHCIKDDLAFYHASHKIGPFTLKEIWKCQENEEICTTLCLGQRLEPGKCACAIGC